MKVSNVTKITLRCLPDKHRSIDLPIECSTTDCSKLICKKCWKKDNKTRLTYCEEHNPKIKVLAVAEEKKISKKGKNAFSILTKE